MLKITHNSKHQAERAPQALRQQQELSKQKTEVLNTPQF